MRSFIILASMITVLLCNGWLLVASECSNSINGTAIESSETEVKFLIPDLGALPADILTALSNDEMHERILSRGIVLQEYLPVEFATITDLYSRLRSAGIPFGTYEQQMNFLQSGVAQEIRLLSKSMMSRDGSFEQSYQITIKGAGGLSVIQLETPAKLSEQQQLALAAIVRDFHQNENPSVNKISFACIATDRGNRPLVDTTGNLRVVEVDVFVEETPHEKRIIFINGEIEFHGATVEVAITEAANWRNQTALRPAYFGIDLTDQTGIKSRDIAKSGPPLHIQEMLAPFAASNQNIVNTLASNFARWTHPRN